MNRYGNIAGVHTPKTTAKYLTRLRLDFPQLKFEDNAWHNDAADNILVTGTTEKDEVSIFMPCKAEGYPEFNIQIRDDQGVVRSLEGRPDFSSSFNTYKEMKAGLRKLLPTPPAEELAHEFARVLRKHIGIRKLREVVRINRERNDSTCASHDYCDSNMTMLEAFENVAGREMDLDDDTTPRYEADNNAFNKAWSQAKHNNFYI